MHTKDFILKTAKKKREQFSSKAAKNLLKFLVIFMDFFPLKGRVQWLAQDFFVKQRGGVNLKEVKKF